MRGFENCYYCCYVIIAVLLLKTVITVTINWEQILTETDDINVLVNHWTSTVSLIIDKYAPLSEMRVSESTVLGLVET